MISHSLRKIEARLSAIASDPEQFTAEELRHIAVQIGAQAEMVERGLTE
jgi:hypothetical protein